MHVIHISSIFFKFFSVKIRLYTSDCIREENKRIHQWAVEGERFGNLKKSYPALRSFGTHRLNVKK